MYGSPREARRGLRKSVSRVGDLVCGSLMRDVDQTGIRANPEDYALHRGDVVIASAEVGQQSDDRLLHC